MISKTVTGGWGGGVPPKFWSTVGATWPSWGAIVASRRPPRFLVDLGSFFHIIYQSRHQNRAKGYQKAANVSQRATEMHQKVNAFQEHVYGAPTFVLVSNVGAAWSILCAILAPTRFRRADPLCVSQCIRRNRKQHSNHTFVHNCIAKIGNAKKTKNMNITKDQSIWRFSMF